MKRKILYWQATLVVPALVLAFSVQAHEPEKHMKEAEKPECAAMKTMDPSKMDRDDPVMQAMMQKCMDNPLGRKKGEEWLFEEIKEHQKKMLDILKYKQCLECK